MTEHDPRDPGEPRDWSAPEPGDEELAGAAAGDDDAMAAENRVAELFTPIDYAHAQPWIDFWTGDGGPEEGTAASGEAFRQAADEASAAGDRLLASALEAIAEREDGGEPEPGGSVPSGPWPNAETDGPDDDA